MIFKESPQLLPILLKLLINESIKVRNQVLLVFDFIIEKYNFNNFIQIII